MDEQEKAHSNSLDETRVWRHEYSMFSVVVIQFLLSISGTAKTKFKK